MTMIEDEWLGLPYFVYGTLRPGGGNDDIWGYCVATACHDGEVFVEGWEMYGLGVPTVVRTDDETSRVYGALIVPPLDEDLRIRLRNALDDLEGHPRAYVRENVLVHLPDRRLVSSWIYSGERFGRRADRLIPSGDWMKHNERSTR